MSFEHGDSDHPIWEADTGSQHDGNATGGYVRRYRGVVISNDDPMQENRLEVTVPTSTSRLRGRFRRTTRSTSIPPDAGADVWIEYDDGDPACPRWVGVA
ncbi:MAG: phage baseplate assembly protein V [Ilumatobacteraceae bacterium]